MKKKHKEDKFHAALMNSGNPAFTKPISDAEISKILDKIPIDRVRAHRWRYLYNISPEDYAAMLNYQNGTCAICSRVNACGKPLVVDHDHKTGVVRGLLCNKCNIALGGFEDNYEFVMSAASYLYRYFVKEKK